jgi:glycine/D-amino acid oxidase-like deaminating enzyme
MNTVQPDLPATTDIVIIGAGIAGISAAWFLQKAGLRVTVCEKGIVAGEQSSRNWGWCRQQGRDQAELPRAASTCARTTKKWRNTTVLCRSLPLTVSKPGASTAHSSNRW